MRSVDTSEPRIAGVEVPHFTRARDREIITYDAVNRVDGRRSIAPIRNILTAAYGVITEEALFQYFKQLERLKAVTMQ